MGKHSKAEDNPSVICPRCDREFRFDDPVMPNNKEATPLARAIHHVSHQHPDHDPEWYDTHSKNHLNEETPKVST